MILRAIKRLLLNLRINYRLSLKRIIKLNRIVGADLTKPNGRYKRVLEVGCANGKDFIQFCRNNDEAELVGLDIQDYGLQQENFKMVVGDAEKIEYPDNYFDLTVSFGVLEHIQPIEKLCAVISEIDRVSKNYVVVVPSISTIVEPHVASLLWQLRARGKKKNYSRLNYFSDEAWLQFEGFSQAKLQRFYHLPPFVSNLMLYKISE
jgi:ubiquinone/menaquinone biosynthesis C-methylase UbiE